jgi:hypothetical protein
MDDGSESDAMLQDLANLTTILLGVCTAIAWLLRRRDDPAIAQTAQRATTILGLLFVVCLIGALGASIASSVPASATKHDALTGKSSLLSRGIDELRPAIKRAFLRTPLDQNGWDISPTELNHYRFDLTQPRRKIVLNVSFMDRALVNIISGKANWVVSEIRAAPNQTWRWLRETNDFRLDGTDNALEIQRANTYERDKGPEIGLYVLTKPPVDAVVMSTHSVANEGCVTPWGPVFTKLEGEALTWECRVMFFDREGNHRSEIEFSKHPPSVHFTRDPLAQEKELEDKTDCYAWLQTFTHGSKSVTDGKTLCIEIPKGFGDSVVWVSFRVGLPDRTK